MTEPTSQDTKAGRSDHAHAIRFMAIKAAIFVLLPLVAAGLAVVFLMPK
ncbi:MAG: phosphoribosylformylglycinamidine synthase-associated small membrane protein [Hyphomicrobium sp.]